MKKIIKFLHLFFLFSCQNITSINEKEIISDKIIKKAAIQIKKEKDLIPAGTIGQMMDEIKVLGINFSYHQKLNIKKGREMIIYSAKTLADKINEETKIRPYLCIHPFPPQKTEINFYLYNPDGSLLPPGELSIISLTNGIIKYKMEDPQTTYLKIIYQETYEEALEKIKSQATKD